MILVVGATGMLGSEICRRLSAAGKPVRALVRATSDQVKVNKLKGYGVELARGDLRDPASLAAACRGVTAVICTASSAPFCYEAGKNDFETVDMKGVMSLIDAARAAGLQHFVYTSFTMEVDFPLRNAKRAVEKYLRNSGLTYTILRPSYFMEVWLTPPFGFDVANAKAQVRGSGENPLSLISYPDLAEFAVRSLDSPVARNAILPLGGPEALSQLETIRVFEEIGGRPFEVQRVSVSALEEQQREAKDPFQETVMGLMRSYAAGDPIDMRETLKAFPIQLTSVKDYARGVLGAA